MAYCIPSHSLSHSYFKYLRAGITQTFRFYTDCLGAPYPHSPEHFGCLLYRLVDEPLFCLGYFRSIFKRRSNPSRLFSQTHRLAIKKSSSTFQSVALLSSLIQPKRRFSALYHLYLCETILVQLLKMIK